jgi:hypothetical protein
MATDIELFESPDLLLLYFCLWGWKNGEVYERNLDTRDELLPRILDAAALVTKSEDQLRRKTHGLRTRVAKCVEVGGGIFNIYCEM